MVIKMAIIRLLDSNKTIRQQIQSVFLDSLNKKQTIIFNVILISYFFFTTINNNISFYF